MCSKELSAEVAIDMQQVSMPSMHGWNLNLNQNKCFFFFLINNFKPEVQNKCYVESI